MRLSNSLAESAWKRFKDFACPLRYSPLDQSLQRPNPYDITSAKSPHQYPVSARTSRVFIFIFITGPSPGSSLLDLLVRIRDFDDCGALESFHKSRTARMGGDCSNSKYLFPMQDRRSTRLVGNPDVHSVRKSYHLDHPLHRRGKELRKRRRFWNWFAVAADNFLSDPRFRHRAVSGPLGFASGRRCTAAAACLGLLGTESRGRFYSAVTLHQLERVVLNTLTGPVANRLETIGSTLCLFCLLQLHPFWLPLFVERGYAFARFLRFARLHVIL
jgi:hypothetical protein